MYVNWRALVILVVLAVAGYFAYQKFVVSANRYEKMTAPQLVEAYAKSDIVDREMIDKELSRRMTGSKLSAEDLRPWLKRREESAGYQIACEYLGRLRDRKSVDVLLKDLEHASPQVRIGATKYFQFAPAQRAFAPLVKNLDHASDEVRKAAVVALENMAERTTTGVRYKAEPTKWKEWWESLSKAEKNKIPE